MSANSLTDRPLIGGLKMKKHIAITVFTILLATLACSFAWSEGTQEVRLGDYLLLRVRCPAGGYTIDERVNALQLRANNLLKGGKEYSAFTVRKAGKDCNIYVDDTFFMTVGPGRRQSERHNQREAGQHLGGTPSHHLPQVYPRQARCGQAGSSGRAGQCKVNPE